VEISIISVISVPRKMDGTQIVTEKRVKIGVPIKEKNEVYYT